MKVRMLKARELSHNTSSSVSSSQRGEHQRQVMRQGSYMCRGSEGLGRSKIRSRRQGRRRPGWGSEMVSKISFRMSERIIICM